MKKFIEKLSEIILFSFFFILPFSYGEVSNKWRILFVVVIVLLMFFLFSRNRNRFNILNNSVIYYFLLMVIFSFIEKVNFIQQFNIPIAISRRIPLSTILLAFGMLIYLTRVLIEGKLQVSVHPFVKYFFGTCIFLFSLMLLFYPFLFFHYQMNLDPDIQLTNRILKYLMILLLVQQYCKNEIQVKRLTYGLITSLSLTLIINIIF